MCVGGGGVSAFRKAFNKEIMERYSASSLKSKL